MALKDVIIPSKPTQDGARDDTNQTLLTKLEGACVDIAAQMVGATTNTFFDFPCTVVAAADASANELRTISTLSSSPASSSLSP